MEEAMIEQAADAVALFWAGFLSADAGEVAQGVSVGPDVPRLAEAEIKALYTLIREDVVAGLSRLGEAVELVYEIDTRPRRRLAVLCREVRVQPSAVARAQNIVMRVGPERVTVNDELLWGSGEWPLPACDIGCWPKGRNEQMEVATFVLHNANEVEVRRFLAGFRLGRGFAFEVETRAVCDTDVEVQLIEFPGVGLTEITAGLRAEFSNSRGEPS